MAVTNEMIMAYADGELNAAGRAEVEAAIALNADIAAQVDAHRKLRASFADAFDAVLKEPVPERLVAAARRRPGAPTDNVVDLAKFRTKPDAPARGGVPHWIQGGAIAATLVIGVMAGRLWLASPAAPLVVGPSGRMAAQGALAVALNDQLASRPDNTAKAVVIGVSFRSNQGPYCRTFQVNQGPGLAGVACRAAQGWAVRMVMVSPPQAATSGYRTAATETPAPVLDAVQAMIAGEPLDAKAEAVAKAGGWRP